MISCIPGRTAGATDSGAQVTATDQPGKICAICGVDCSDRPRIKDPGGRYFCKTCYQEAKRRKDERKARSQTPPTEAAAPPSADILRELHEESAQRRESACPGCGQPLADDAVICTNCGPNISTGRVPASVVVRAEPREVAGKTSWPLVMGVISIVLGVAGILANGINLAVAIVAGVGVAVISAGTTIMLLSAWLLLVGIGIIRRKPSAVQSIRRWAIVKIVLYATCHSALIVGLFTSREVPARFARLLGPEGGYVEPGALAWVLLALLAWFLLWPIVVLLWLSRAGIKQDPIA